MNYYNFFSALECRLYFRRLIFLMIFLKYFLLVFLRMVEMLINVLDTSKSIPRTFLIPVKILKMKNKNQINFFLLFLVCTITLVLTFYAFVCSVSCVYQVFFGLGY